LGNEPKTKISGISLYDTQYTVESPPLPIHCSPPYDVGVGSCVDVVVGSGIVGENPCCWKVTFPINFSPSM
jgi:hypothetical protein